MRCGDADWTARRRSGASAAPLRSDGATGTPDTARDELLQAGIGSGTEVNRRVDRRVALKEDLGRGFGEAGQERSSDRYGSKAVAPPTPSEIDLDCPVPVGEVALGQRMVFFQSNIKTGIAFHSRRSDFKLQTAVLWLGSRGKAFSVADMVLSGILIPRRYPYSPGARAGDCLRQGPRAGSINRPRIT